MLQPAIQRFPYAPRAWLLSLGILGAPARRVHSAESAPTPVRTPSPPASGTAAAREVLRQTYAYDPKVRQKAEAEAVRKVAGGAVQMDAVIITEDKDRNPSFENFIARQRLLNAAKKPSLERGAEIHGLPGVGVMPYVDALPFGPPTARWSLISCRFKRAPAPVAKRRATLEPGSNVCG